MSGSGGSGGSGGMSGSGGSGGSGGMSGSGGSGGEGDASVDAGPEDAAPVDGGDDGGAPDAGGVDGNQDVEPVEAGGSDVIDDAGAGITVLYVIGSLGTGITSDSQIIDRLVGRGYSVTIKNDTGVVAADTMGKAAVFLSASTTLANVMTALAGLPTLTTPVLAMDENLEQFLNLTGGAGQHGATAAQTQVSIIAGADATFTAGLTGNVTVYNAPFAIGFGVPGAGAIKVATIVGNADHVTLYAYPPMAAMANNQMAPAKRAFYFVRDSPTANIVTEDGLKLYDAISDWITH